MIYVTSDLHLCHNRPFMYEHRGFNSIEEHDEAIVENWNLIVKPEDEVYILGDLVLSDAKKGLEYLRQLNGKKYIVIGNHDTTTKVEQYKTISNMEILGHASMLKYKKYHIYLSHYPTITSNWDYDKPLRTRVINLCGHTHCGDPWKDWDKGLIYHVELDAHDNCPIALDTIIEEIKAKMQLEKEELETY